MTVSSQHSSSHHHGVAEVGEGEGGRGSRCQGVDGADVGSQNGKGGVNSSVGGGGGEDGDIDSTVKVGCVRPLALYRVRPFACKQGSGRSHAVGRDTIPPDWPVLATISPLPRKCRAREGTV